MLKFTKLLATDGNNSLRRTDEKVTHGTTPYIDTRTMSSDIWLNPEQVNLFKDEVRARAPAKKSVKVGSYVTTRTLAN